MKLPRHAELWLPGYLGQRLQRFTEHAVRRVWLAVADHYEPFWNRPPLEQARQRVTAWRRQWPEIARAVPTDSAGRPPKHTFFYPQEEYRPEFLTALAEMTQAGIADVEVHIHHDGEGSQDFVHRIAGFCEALVRDHGLLRQSEGRTQFGFIHGNWALDNSLPAGKWCGLNDEITILRDLGCYADFTMPSGNSPSQARCVNQIYWCTDDPASPKSHDRGQPARIGRWADGDLLMIPGPLGLRWRERIVPRMETGEIAAYDLPTPYRVRRWFDLAPRIADDVFIKLYTHGAPETNSAALLNGGLERLYSLVTEEVTRRSAELHYVSTWEMYCAIRSLCQGRSLAAAGGAGAADPQPAAERCGSQ